MLKFLAPKIPPRTLRNNLTTLFLDDGHSKVVFNAAFLERDLTVHQTNNPNSAAPKTESDTSLTDHAAQDSPPHPPYLVLNSLPPAPSSPAQPTDSNSSLCPPFHIHLKEDETFHVLTGTANFLLLDQSTNVSNHGQPPNTTPSKTTKDGLTSHLIQAGHTITIPRGQIHTFRNASTTQRLALEFGFSPSSSSDNDSTTNSNSRGSSDLTHRLNAKMHTFFLNTQLYRSDCTKHSVPRSLLQVLLFNHHADVALVPPFLLAMHRRFPILRSLIERVVAPFTGRVMNVLGGVVLGRWVCGLRSSYEEYTTLAPVEDDVLLRSTQRMERDGKYASRSDESRTVVQNGEGAANPWVCQAWRDHNFDGQDESWRKDL